MLEYHNIISKATGIKCGISENEFEINVLNALKSEKNMEMLSEKNVMKFVTYTNTSKKKY